MFVNMKKLDMLCIGESLRDVFYIIHEASVSCSINKDRCLLCLEYAEKIPIKEVVKTPAAGNAANAAVCSRRLGLSSSIISWVGNDSAGRELKATLIKEGVHVSNLCAYSKQFTSEATILSFQGERTQLIYFKPRNYKLPKMPAARCIYYSAMGNKFKNFDNALLKHLRANPETIFSFQPGTTHIRAGLNHLKPLIARSHIFVLNKTEAIMLLGGEDRTMENLLDGFMHLGANIVAITDGVNGAYAFDGAAYWHMPIYDGQAKERTGAGDAFAASFTCAILKKLDLQEALRWGTANAWSVVNEIGPQKGLLTQQKLTAIVKKFSHIKPVKINGAINKKTGSQPVKKL